MYAKLVWNKKGKNNMMKLGINGGSMTINDDNTTEVSSDIAKHINDNFEKPDGADDSKKPDLTLKD